MAMAAVANAIFRHSFAVFAAFSPEKTRLNIIAAAALVDRSSPSIFRYKLLFAADLAASYPIPVAR